MISFKQAVKQHSMLKQTVDGLQAAGKDIGYLEEGWDALVFGGGTGTVADALRNTVPIEYIPLLRSADGIPAAFALVATAMHIFSGGVDLEEGFAVREAVRKAWKDFENRRKQANNIKEGFGADLSQSWATLRDVCGDVDAQSKMQGIADLAGAMYRALKYRKLRHDVDSPQEVIGATIGGDVSRLLANEIAMLANHETKDMASIKILERRAQQYKMIGQDDRSRGPMVLLIDESGSMHDARAGYRGRNTWAKACAVALIRIAWQENRAVSVVHFGSGTVITKVPKNDIKALWQMAHSFLSGGTDIGHGLEVSLDQVDEMGKEGDSGADIVIITDGEDGGCGIPNSLDEMDRKNVRLFSVSIGGGFGKESPLRKRAAQYVHANDEQLGDADTVTSLKDAAMAGDAN